MPPTRMMVLTSRTNTTRTRRRCASSAHPGSSSSATTTTTRQPWCGAGRCRSRERVVLRPETSMTFGTFLAHLPQAVVAEGQPDLLGHVRRHDVQGSVRRPGGRSERGATPGALPRRRARCDWAGPLRFLVDDPVDGLRPEAEAEHAREVPRVVAQGPQGGEHHPTLRLGKVVVGFDEAQVAPQGEPTLEVRPRRRGDEGEARGGVLHLPRGAGRRPIPAAPRPAPGATPRGRSPPRGRAPIPASSAPPMSVPSR